MAEGEFEIRGETMTMTRMRSEHVPGAVQLYQEAFHRTYPRAYIFDEQQLWANVQAGPADWFVVVNPSNAVVGVAEISDAGQGVSKTGRLAVSKAYQNKGMANQMGVFVTKTAQEAGYRILYSAARTDHTHSQKLARALGMPCIGATGRKYAFESEATGGRVPEALIYYCQMLNDSRRERVTEFSLVQRAKPVYDTCARQFGLESRITYVGGAGSVGRAFDYEINADEKVVTIKNTHSRDPAPLARLCSSFPDHYLELEVPVRDIDAQQEAVAAGFAPTVYLPSWFSSAPGSRSDGLLFMRPRPERQGWPKPKVLSTDDLPAAQDIGVHGYSTE